MPTYQDPMISPSTQSCTIERLNENNLKDLVDLHRAVYGKVDENYYQKKYNTSYSGIRYVGFIAYNKDRLAIAYYGVLPCFIQFEKERVLSAQSADTMTLPVHRYKGMFVELSRITFELCRQLGIRIVFGFPNQNSYHGAVHKLGWKLTHSLDYFQIPVKTFPLESTAGRFTLTNKVYMRYLSLLLTKNQIEADGIPSTVLEEGFAGLERSPEFLKYKTYSPSFVVQVADAKIWLRIRNDLRIGDLENVNKENFIAVIDSLKALARRAGVPQISFHCSPGTGLHKLFSENFPALPSFPVLFQDFDSPLDPEKIRFTYADLDIF